MGAVSERLRGERPTEGGRHRDQAWACRQAASRAPGAPADLQPSSSACPSLSLHTLALPPRGVPLAMASASLAVRNGEATTRGHGTWKGDKGTRAAWPANPSSTPPLPDPSQSPRSTPGGHLGASAHRALPTSGADWRME